jgi:hypothetical protein
MTLVLSLVVALGAGVSSAWGQTPTTPTDPNQPQQPGTTQQEQQQQQPPAPTPPPTDPTVVPLQQFPIQAPGRPTVTPGIPPSTTIPPWTPPVLPAPSQTNVPAPFPLGGTGQPGFVGGRLVGAPGAFAPTITSIRGATLEFHPTLRAAGEYSDNFFQSSSGAQENFRSTLGPGFNLLLNGARTLGTLATTVDLVHDTVDDSGDEIKVFPSVFAALRYSLTPRLALTVSDAFVRSDSSSTVDQNGIRRGRQTSSTNTFGLTADWLIDRFATQAYYRNVLFFNEGDNQGGANAGTGSRNDSMSNILGVNASTQVFTDYVVRGGYEFSRTDQTGGDNTGFGGDTTTHSVFGSAARQFGLFTSAGVSSTYSYQTLDDTTIWNVSLFGSHGIPQGLSVAGSVGYSRLMNNSGDNDSEHAVSASLTGSYRFATRAVLSVGVSQDFRQTGQQGENFGTVLSRSYFGSFLYQFTPFINSTLFVRYSENEPTGTGNIDDTGTQKTLTYGASVNWQVLRWLSASLQYEYLQQRNNNVFNQTVGGTSGDFAENRVTLSLFATF